MYDHVVLHYSEIGTKSSNRRFFENLLRRNVAAAARPWATVDVRRETGRLVFSLRDVPEESLEPLLAAVGRQPGVAWLSPTCRTEPTVEALSEAVVALARNRTGSFKIRARRSTKKLPFDSMHLNRELGSAVQAATGRAVDVHRPETEYRVEVDARAGYVLDARREGPGGLPVGSAGKAVALLSGGIDSPVAAYRMMVRGCQVIALHLWNRTFSGDGVRDKVLRLGAALARHHGRLKLLLVPFEDIQREIVAAAPAELRMLLYRRAMLVVADALRVEIDASATIVGDSVGQVASQTIQNLAAVYEIAAPPVLAPLCATNKADVVAEARRIGTFDISSIPAEDCCGLMVARHPETSANAARLRDCEQHYDLAALAAEALAARETHVLDPAP